MAHESLIDRSVAFILIYVRLSLTAAGTYAYIVQSTARVIQNVCSLPGTDNQKRYIHHTLSFFDVVSYNRNALGPVFLQSSDSMVEEFLSWSFSQQFARQTTCSSSANLRFSYLLIKPNNNIIVQYCSASDTSQRHL